MLHCLWYFYSIGNHIFCPIYIFKKCDIVESCIQVYESLIIAVNYSNWKKNRWSCSIFMYFLYDLYSNSGYHGLSTAFACNILKVACTI